MCACERERGGEREKRCLYACVCVCERERERACLCACVHASVCNVGLAVWLLVV